MDFVGNFLLFPVIKIVLKNRLRFDKVTVMNDEFSGIF